MFILFQHDMASGDFKDLPRRTASDKVLHDKTFNVSKISKYNGYQIGLASIVYRFFEKKSIEGQKKVLQLLIPFKMFQMNRTKNQIKYGQIETANFTIDQ